MRNEPWAIFKSSVALALVFGCLWAAQWQYHRGVDRHARNAIIKNHVDLPSRPLSLLEAQPEEHEWQNVTVRGHFDLEQQILLRNRYSEGVYGFEVLTLFSSIDGKKFWVDRGWVKAGRTATTRPVITVAPEGEIEISGRLRLDSSLPRGAFFALPTNSFELVSDLNAQSRLETEKFYIDLLSGSQESLTPAVPAQLPPLSDGPHMAYAFQWVFFAGLIIYGRILIRRTR